MDIDDWIMVIGFLIAPFLVMAASLIIGML